MLIVSTILVAWTSYAQESPEERKKKADKLFDKEQYIEATPIYLNLLGSDRKNYELNYRYGACLLFNSFKKQDAFKYLTYAVQHPDIDPDAYYFLAKSFHLNYQFNQAIRNYQMYLQKAGDKAKPQFDVTRQIEMCENGKRLMTTITDIVVLEKKEIDIASFFRIYKLDNIGGTIILKSDFQTKIDKKYGHVPLIHFPSNTDRVFYSSYGETDLGQKDIYVRQRLPDNTWSLPQKAGGNVNTKYDEDFPYMQPGGRNLYFCSKGHNSMGGYDIFRSRYNPDDNTFGPPENMDFAITSPDNDMFYVVDSLDKQAYFASSRQSKDGKMYVYKVRVERLPLQLAIIKGTFNSDINPANKKMTVVVTDYANGQKIGTFTTNEKGNYLITFPKGGKYAYDVTIDGAAEKYNYVVSIPFLNELRPLKQRIIEENVKGNDTIRVVDLFDELLGDDERADVMAQIIQDRMDLNPNAHLIDTAKLDNRSSNLKLLDELGIPHNGLHETVAAFEEMERQQGEKLQVLENLANGALSNAMEKLKAAEQLQMDAKNLVNRANQTTNSDQKYQFFVEAKKAVDEANAKKTSVAALITFADSVGQQIPKNQELHAAIEAITVEIKKEVLEDNQKGLEEIIAANKGLIAELRAVDKSNPIENKINQRLKVSEDRKKLEKQEATYIDTENVLEKEIKALKEELKTARKKDIPDIEGQIASKTGELQTVTDEKNRVNEKIAKLTRQEAAINAEIADLQNITAVKDGPKVAPDEAKQKLDELNSKNFSSLEAFINSQLENMQKDPALADRAPAKDPVVNKLNEQLATTENDIKNAEGTPAEKAEKLLTALVEQEKAIDDELNGVDRRLETNPADEEAAGRKQELRELKAANADRIETQKKVTSATQPVATPANDAVAQVLREDYTSSIEEIRNSAGTPEQKAADIRKAQQQMLNNIDSELAAVDRKIAANLDDKPAAERRKALEELRAQTEKDIAGAGTTAAVTNSADNIVKDLKDDHTERMSAIDASAETPAQKNADKLAEMKRYDASLNDELEAANNRLKSNPNDAQAKQQKAELEGLVAGNRSDIAAAQQQLAETNVVNPETQTPKGAAVARQLKKDTDNRIAAINASDAAPAQKLKDIISAETALDQQLDREIQVVNNQLEANPDDQSAKDLKQELLGMKVRNASEKSSNEAALRQLEQPDVVSAETTEGRSLAEGKRDLDASLAAIDMRQDLTPKEKAQQQLQQLKAYENEVDERLAVLTDRIDSNPQDADATREKAQLEPVRSATQADIARLEDRIADMDGIPADIATNVDEALRNIAPNYEEDLRKAGGRTPVETLEAKNEVDRNVIAKIDQELETLESEAGNEDARQQTQILNSLRDKLINNMEERYGQIGLLNDDPAAGNEMAAEELEKLAPDYTEDMLAAQHEDVQKAAKAKNKVDEAVIPLVTKELAQVEKALQNNPDNSDLADRRDALALLEDRLNNQVQERAKLIDGQTALSNETPLKTVETPLEANAASALITKVRPAYEENVRRINATKAGTDKDVSLLREDIALKNDLDAEVEKLDGQLRKSPDNKDIEGQLNVARAAQTELQQQINDNTNRLVTAAGANINREQLLESIDPDYRRPDVNAPGLNRPALAKNEQDLQEKIDKRIAANNKSLTRLYDPSLVAENDALAEMKKQSDDREAVLSVALKENPAVMAAIEKDLGDQTKMVMNSSPKDEEEATTILRSLDEYSNVLADRREDLENTPQPDQDAIALVKDQQKEVQRRRGVIEFDLEEMFNTARIESSGSEEERKLLDMAQKEDELRKKLEDPSLSPGQKREVARDLKEVEAQKKEQEKVVINQGVESTQALREVQSTKLGVSNPNNELAKAIVERAKDMTTVSPKDLKSAGNADQLNKKRQAEEHATILLDAADSYLLTDKTYKKEGLVTETIESLNTKKHVFEVEVGQLQAQIDKVIGDPTRRPEMEELANQRKQLEMAVSRIDDMISQLERERIPDRIAKDGMSVNVPYEEEVKLAGLPGYPELVRRNLAAQELLREFNSVVNEKDKIRTELQNTTSESQRQELIVSLRRLDERKADIRGRLNASLDELEAAIAKEDADPLKIKNLLARNVAPVKKIDIASVIPLPAGGFEMKADPPATNKNIPLPVDVKMPGGLVYRVQVGAFAKPIPENLFREFSPVTGEKLNNGIVRYMAGYFGNRGKVIEAQRAIKALGYADCFIVAYCDGERITLDQARRMEDAGLCVPKSQETILQEVQQNTIAQLPQDSLRQLFQPVKKGDYNRAPGAAPAVAAEERLGLFYTVQVGVYNHPASAIQVKEITPLVTKRLENGQIRYSSGIFQSPQAARPKKQEAIARGITDAFITAYYNGERISLTEAERLLAEKGPAILEKDGLTTVSPTAVADAKTYIASQPVTVNPKAPVQVVSQQTYASYPREVMNRYNTYGSFYYDEKDGHIKSSNYTKNSLPNLELLAGEVDTVAAGAAIVAAASGSNYDYSRGQTIVASWDEGRMSGELGDWLLRLTLPHTGASSEKGFSITFDNLTADQVTMLKNRLTFYGASEVRMVGIDE